MEVEKFKFIFEGLDIAYGQHQPNGSRADGKQEGQSSVVRKEVTDELWEKHLKGEGPSLGIIPIRADNTTKWGCIDIDDYPIDTRNLILKIRKLKLPLVYCKSKSGGAHLFLFMKSTIASKTMKIKLSAIAALLGQSNAEIFPKQSGIQPEKGEVGNFLNLPYYHAMKTIRFAIKNNGERATLNEFYAMYDKYIVGDLDKVNIKGDEEAIKDGPPCLQALCDQGFPEGTRNNGLFNIGVYLKKFDPTNWEKILEKYNQKYMEPPLDHKEISIIVKQLNKKDYRYKCKDQPIVSYCNASVCKFRKYGVGENNVMQEIGVLTKLDSKPPIWWMEIPNPDPEKPDYKIQLSTEQLQSQPKFQLRVMEDTNSMPPLMKNSDWQQLIDAKMKKAQITPVSSDGSVSGQFLAHLQEFCTERAQARTKEEIRQRRPWTQDDPEASDYGTTYFRLKDLHAHLIRNRFNHYGNSGQIIAALQDVIPGWNVEKAQKFFKIKGRGVNVWGIPSFDKQEDEPEAKSKEEFNVF